MRCQYCGKEFEQSKYNKGHIYCSDRCRVYMWKYKKTGWIPKWRLKEISPLA
jgi:hypothetical protein